MATSKKNDQQNNNPQPKTIMITGATGYVAGHIVKLLLENGHHVHAPVRDPKSTDKLKYLNEIASKNPGTIKYFKADLLNEGSYQEAMDNCEIVIHSASPFTTNVKDPQKDLVDPALLGTRNVLNEASKTSSVKRVVLTSSVAAIYSDNVDLKKTKNNIFTEEHWNTSSSLEHQPYYYSKTVAEREAWKIAGGQTQWKLVVVNPSLVIGPGINPNSTSESLKIVKQFGDGTAKSGLPKMGLGAVDVRDVAQAHYNAAFLPDANGRHIVSGHNTDLYELASSLQDKFGDNYPIPKNTIPKFLVWAVGPLLNESFNRKTISLNMGLPWKADNSKSKEELNVTYRPLKKSMEEFFQQIADYHLS